MQDTGPGNGKNAGWYESGIPRILAQLLPLGRLPGSLARGICQAWVSGSTDPEKVPAFFEFVGTFFHAKPIETHRDSFHCAIWLDAGTFPTGFHIDPRTSLRMPPELFIPLLSALIPAATSLLHKIFFDQFLHISHIQWILLRLIS